jgi:hypothetical protein
MSVSPRTSARLALVIALLAAASLSVQAQEIKDRQLLPAYDFAKVQMPVKIVSIELAGKTIAPGEPIKGDDNWLRGISFTLENVSDQPIAYVDIGFKFPLPNGFVVYNLNYGVDMARGEPRRAGSPPAIEPGQTVELVLNDRRYESFLNVLSQANAPSKFETASFYVETVCFEGQPDVIWQGGYLKRRHPTEIGRFDAFERYVLPARQN